MLLVVDTDAVTIGCGLLLMVSIQQCEVGWVSIWIRRRLLSTMDKKTLCFVLRTDAKQCVLCGKNDLNRAAPKPLERTGIPLGSFAV